MCNGILIVVVDLLHNMRPLTRGEWQRGIREYGDFLSQLKQECSYDQIQEILNAQSPWKLAFIFYYFRDDKFFHCLTEEQQNKIFARWNKWDKQRGLAKIPKESSIIYSDPAEEIQSIVKTSRSLILASRHIEHELWYCDEEYKKKFLSKQTTYGSVGAILAKFNLFGEDELFPETALRYGFSDLTELKQAISTLPDREDLEEHWKEILRQISPEEHRTAQISHVNGEDF